MVRVKSQATFTCTSNMKDRIIFDILVNNGFTYEYHSTIEATSVFDARAKWRKRGDWTTESFKVRKVKSMYVRLGKNLRHEIE